MSSSEQHHTEGLDVLHITRREFESVKVDGAADIMVRRIKKGRVLLSIAAPDETRIVRGDARKREPKKRERKKEARQ